MKNILIIVLVLCSIGKAKAQFNNEWIDYTKTYYKFKVATDGLYRINQSALQSAGLASTVAQNFQLWRNGVQIPIYTSQASGVLAVSDYIEFWAKAADGAVDKKLYVNPINHLNDKHSLYEDSASYFLTVNTNAVQNLRLVNTANNVAANTLPVTPNFMHTIGYYPKDFLHQGFAVSLGSTDLASSEYDAGEGWTTNWIENGSTFVTPTISNLFPDLSATTLCTYKQGAVGIASNIRTLTVKINNNQVMTHLLDYRNIANATSSFPVSVLTGGTANITTTNSYQAQDRYAIGYQEIIYPRLFNMGGAINFPFSLPSNAAGNYLEITNFNITGGTPVLYDLTNGVRYVANVNGTQLRFLLLPSSVTRNLVLVSQNTSNINTVASLQGKTFTNFMAPSQQANFIILTAKYLHPTVGRC